MTFPQTVPFRSGFFSRSRWPFLRSCVANLNCDCGIVDALGPASLALHIPVQILHVNLQTSFVHVFRALHWDVSHEWAASLQGDIHDWLAQQLQCPIAGPAAQLALAMPLRHAGLSHLNFQYEAALHFLNGALALNDSHSLSLGN